MALQFATEGKFGDADSWQTWIISKDGIREDFGEKKDAPDPLFH